MSEAPWLVRVCLFSRENDKSRGEVVTLPHDKGRLSGFQVDAGCLGDRVASLRNGVHVCDSRDVLLAACEGNKHGKGVLTSRISTSQPISTLDWALALPQSLEHPLTAERNEAYMENFLPRESRPLAPVGHG